VFLDTEVWNYQANSPGPGQWQAVGANLGMPAGNCTVTWTPSVADADWTNLDGVSMDVQVKAPSGVIGIATGVISVIDPKTAVYTAGPFAPPPVGGQFFTTVFHKP
jgi:hypothetical protein